MFFSNVLLGLLNALNFALFTFFISDEKGGDEPDPHFHDDTKNNHDEGDTTCTDHSVSLQAAYKCFETTPQEATRDYIKKKYKRLSLLHHPDRNGNSPESVVQMQEINAFMDLLGNELDRKEGVTPAAEDESEDENNDGPSPSSSPEKKDISKEERKRRKKARQKAKRKRKRATFRRREEMETVRRKMEQEMKKEWEDVIWRKFDFQKKQWSMIHKNRRMADQQNLSTPQGRDQAHDTWKTSVQEFKDKQLQKAQQMNHSEEEHSNLHDIDEDFEPGSPNTNNDENGPDMMEKPKNPIMDYCNDDIVIALRMGETEIAMELVHDAIDNKCQLWLVEHIQLMQEMGLPISPHAIHMDDSFRDGVLNVLMKPLDEDGNHILHYAVYLEDDEMVSYLVGEARKMDRFPTLLTSTNHRGETVLDFCIGCHKDSRIPDRVQTFWEEANEAIESQQLGPTFQRFVDKIVRSTNFEPTGRTICALFVGKYIFQWGWIMTLLVGGWSFYMTERSIGAELFITHTWLSIVHILFQFVWRWILSSFFYVKAGLVVCFCGYFRQAIFSGIMLLSLPLYMFLDWILTYLPSIPARFRRYKQVIHFCVLTCLAIGLQLLWRNGSLVSVYESSSQGPSPIPVYAFQDPNRILNPRERALAMFDNFEEEE